MIDYGHREADKIISELEQEIATEYRRLVAEMRQKLNAFLHEYEIENEEWKRKVKEGTATDEEYKNWLNRKASERKKIEGFISKLLRDLKRTEEIAHLIIEDHMPEVFEANANWTAYDIERQVREGISFELYDEEKAKDIINQDKQAKRTEIVLGPNKSKTAKIDSWNNAKLKNEVMQGMAKGESMDKIAIRLERVIGMDEVSSIRNARTMVTAMESAGRMETYRRAKEMGIDIIKVWIATLDDRTRHWHADLDGQRREIEEPFEVDGYEIDCPGDPYAEPFLVYNCRCTMMSQIRDMQWDENEIRTVSDDFESYEDWKQRKGSGNG